MSDLTPFQARAAENADRLHVVSAGAGSGKTRVLVRRILHLAQNGTPPDRVLAITFTEKAAAELKRRAVQELADAGMDEERRSAEGAYFGTIHGFCARILREHPLEAGVDPAFAIVSPVDEAIFWEDETARLFADPAFARLDDEMGGASGEGTRVLPAIVRALVAARRESGGSSADLRALADSNRLTTDALARAEEARSARWRRMIALLAGADALTTAEYVGRQSGEKYARLCEHVRALSAEEPRWDLAADLWECIGFYAKVRKPEKAEWQARLEPARTLADSMRGWDAEEADRIERECAARTARIMAWAAYAWDRYDAWKAERGARDFADLQLLALRMLRAQEPVRRLLSERFRHVLLDEAQDTNPLQYEILAQLRHDEDARFVVGDPKQSIYGFRGANLDLFLDVREEADARTELADNFRSRSAILDAVNAAGRAFWAGDPRLGFFALNPGYPYPPEEDASCPRVELCVVEQRPLPGDGAGKTRYESLESAREREARWVARRLREMHDGGDLVWDDRAGAPRPFAWGDAAILLRGRAFDPFERALREAGIPVAVTGAAGFFDGMEVRDLVAGLRVIANTRDEPALLAALRGPLCGIGENALVRLRMARGADRLPLWDVLPVAEVDADTRASLDAFVERIDRLRLLRDVLAPADVLARLVADTGYVARLFAGDHPTARVANVARLESFVRAQPGGLADAVAAVGRAAAHLRDLADAPGADPGDPVVTLCTVHSSKGLEWPIVFLADLSREYWKPASTNTVTPGGGLLLGVRGEDGGWRRPESASVAFAAADRAAVEEAKRLFYVGSTRARERLIWSGVSPDAPVARPETMTEPVEWLRARVGFGAGLGQGMADAEWDGARIRLHWQREEVVAEVGASARPSLAEENADALRAGRSIGDGGASAVADRVRALTVPAIAPEQIAATRLAAYLRCPMIYRLTELGLPSARVRGGAAPARASALGNALHRALQSARFDADPATEAHRLSALVAPPAEREEVAAILESTLRSPIADEVRAAAEVHREAAFYVPLRVEGEDRSAPVLHGVIDLLFRDTDGRWHLVDWKASAGRRKEDRLERYTPQVQLYAAAAAHVQGVGPISTARLHFLREGESVAVPVDADVLDSVRRRASDAVRRIGAGDFAAEAGLHCAGCGFRRGGWCAIGRVWEPVSEDADESPWLIV